MKTSIKYGLLSVVSLSLAIDTHAANPAKVSISNRSDEKIYFQPESSPGYTEIFAKDTVINITDSPAYYRFMAGDGAFYPVFITPGSDTEISVNENGVDIKGSNEKENEFMRLNSYICRTPKSIKSYSDEWVAYNEAEIIRLDSLIDASGLNPEFAATHKLYNRYTFLNQRLGGVTIAKVFRPGGNKIEIGENFYNFLDTLQFSDERILVIPKWFDVIDKALETKESRALLPVSNDTYMTVYANAIDNEKVRSHFLVKLLDLTLKRNYLNDFSRQLPEIRPLITDATALAQLQSLEDEFAEKTRQAANVAAGTPMPDFIFKDVDGKEFRFSDFRGDYVIIDFWFTGCAPCRAEMPYFDQVAKAFDGKGVKFISLSVDTGEELYAEWEKMMREKPHAPGVLSVNLPDGFNSPLLKKLNIHGVPRIMLIDRDGRIVESYAKRPSDPKLRQQLESLTARN